MERRSSHRRPNRVRPQPGSHPGEGQAARPFSKQEILAVPDEDQSWLKRARVTVSWAYQGQPKEVIRELRLHRLANQL